MGPIFISYRGFDIEINARLISGSRFWTGHYEIRRDAGPWAAASLTRLHTNAQDAIDNAASYAREYIDNVIG